MVLPKLLKYSTHAGVHTQLCPSLSCCTPQKLNCGWCQEGNLEPGAGDTGEGDRRGAVGGVTPSPALTGNPDIGQYVATLCSARTAAVSRKLEDHWWAETLQMQDVDHSTILS